MKVILNQTVPKLGKQDQVVTVADGFARNYLFPRKLAVLADKNQVRALEQKLARIEAKSSALKSDAEGVRDLIDGKVVRIEGKVGKDSAKLFGAITPQDVEKAINSLLGVTVDRKKIGLVEPIKRLGDFPIQVALHRDVDATVTVQVFDPLAVVTPTPTAE